MSETESPLIWSFNVKTNLAEWTVKILTSIPAVLRAFFAQPPIILAMNGLCGLKLLNRNWL